MAVNKKCKCYTKGQQPWMCNYCKEKEANRNFHLERHL